jgi:glycosyltransferase involved in cell wall biosynthesis
MILLSVILPTHAPKPEILARTLEALQSQSLPRLEWELLLVDNASPQPLAPTLTAWHPHGRVVREENLGLTHARLRGIVEAAGEVLVWVDDDNVLEPTYLDRVVAEFRVRPRLGAAGGKSLPEYVEPPAPWYTPNLAPLGCRDLGKETRVSRWDDDGSRGYPEFAPIGAGLATRSAAIRQWADAVHGDPRRIAFGRRGNALTSGEDNDINLTLLGKGWELAYFPELSLTHIIPPGRLTQDYQERMARTSFRDFVRVLDLHGIRPWSAIAPWTVPLRALRAWLNQRAWRGPAARIRWQGALGQFEGRARLPRNS